MLSTPMVGDWSFYRNGGGALEKQEGSIKDGAFINSLLKQYFLAVFIQFVLLLGWLISPVKVLLGWLISLVKKLHCKWLISKVKMIQGNYVYVMCHRGRQILISCFIYYLDFLLCKTFSFIDKGPFKLLLVLHVF